MGRTFWGIDIGSITVKVVIFDATGRLLAHRYRRSEGQPRQVLLQLVDELATAHPPADIAGVGLSGSGGKGVAALLGGQHVNELVAQTRAVGEFHPAARTIIEIGGQDSKFLSVRWNDQTQQMDLVDFGMNTLCAAGTGSFLDQQAERLGISIVDEFAAAALHASEPARIAGRCTVFSKSDMIHLQQKGTPLPDILMGLCLALARNYRSVIGKGKPFTPPVLFQGGVAFNKAVARAFEMVLSLPPGGLIIPDHHWIMPALGTGLIAMDAARAGRLPPFRGFDALAEAVAAQRLADRRTLPILRQNGHLNRSPTRMDARRPPVGRSAPRPVALGIDVGSISTNLVLVDPDGTLVARRYLFTAGQPLNAVRRGLRELAVEVGDDVHVQAVGITGSGRYLTGHYVGADVVRNEITAQARAALALDPTVDTIFEIGGQDSKYISLHNGAIVDFAMNNACAAGTGSFLQEQADRLQIDIERSFSEKAFAAAAPACLGERCTVFMESDLIHHQQQGAELTDLTAGLAYSIAQNYLNRVVNRRHVGDNIFFQGGVAWNSAVVAAFETLTGRSITVPANHDVTGAIGVALLAREAMPLSSAHTTAFKGFSLADRNFEMSRFTCQACPALCAVNRLQLPGEPAIFSGARCDRFEEAGRTTVPGADLPDLFAERHALLMAGYVPPDGTSGRPRVAFPRALSFYDMFPYWHAFFAELDMDLVLSDVTNGRTVRATAEHAAVEMCFPARLAFGHVVELDRQEADYLLLPSVRNRENRAPGQTQNFLCPFIQSTPYLLAANLDLSRYPGGVLTPPLFLLWPAVERQAFTPLAEQLGLPWRRVRRAARAAATAQRRYYESLRARGREVLAGLPPDQTAIVIVGRPYNACDPGVSQDLPGKLRRLGVLPIPMEFLPLDDIDVSDQFGNMYWRSGQDILAAAKLIGQDPRLNAIYLTNFNCGPDSFLLSFFRMSLGEKPFLELEIDDHTADAGIITRCEAFIESLRMGQGVAHGVAHGVAQGVAHGVAHGVGQ